MQPLETARHDCGARYLMSVRLWCLVLLTLISWQYTYSQRAEEVDIDSLAKRDDFITASLVTIAPADELYSLFGHEAIRLQCPIHDLDYCFTFEFADRGSIVNFLHGQSYGRVITVPTDDFFNHYREAGRSINEFVLNLNPHEKQQLWMQMDGLAMRDDLRFDYMHNNCTSLSAAAIFYVIEGAIVYSAHEAAIQPHHTLRQSLLEQASHAPWRTELWNFVIGTDGDKGLENDYVRGVTPGNHHAAWTNLNVVRGSVSDRLIGSQHVVFESGSSCGRPPITPLAVGVTLLLLSIGSLLFSVFVRGRYALWSTYCFIGMQLLIGLILSVFVLGTDLPGST